MTHSRIDDGARTQALAGVVTATDNLLDAVAALDADSVRAASRLPGWTRAHVLTHLARHADALRRTTAAAERNELVDPYPGGAAGRAAEITVGAKRDPGEILSDLRASVEDLSEVWRALPAPVWAHETRAVAGTRPLAVGVVARWVEVEVHHVDLDVGYRPRNWSDAFVVAGTRYVLGGLPGRARGAGLRDGEDWLLSAVDLGRNWRVHHSDGGVAVQAVDPPDAACKAVHVVTGPGHALLFWLLGRPADGDDLIAERTTDADRALSLPTLFPFP